VYYNQLAAGYFNGAAWYLGNPMRHPIIYVGLQGYLITMLPLTLFETLLWLFIVYPLSGLEDVSSVLEMRIVNRCCLLDVAECGLQQLLGAGAGHLLNHICRQ
jgi:hypothetical protein